MTKQIMIFVVSIILSSTLYAQNNLQTIEDNQLKKMIGQMLIVGFDEATIDDKSEIVQYIKKYKLGGVILFDKFYTNRDKIKNISSPKQLQLLTSKLQNITDEKLLIAIDQEGGKVERLKEVYGFLSIPSAKIIATKTSRESKKYYDDLATMLYENGINCNFAPVVDLSINKNNYVIEKLERSYGDSSQTVVKYAEIFSDSLNQKHIVSVLKHFPGHGSSHGDSHKGFVDITNSWSKKELEPYGYFIQHNKAKMIMTAHVFNKNLDEKYPATLSYKVNTQLLRQQLGFQGVIVSDDLQMKAISEHYTLKETVTLSINSGVDILLFGNQLSYQNIDELVEVIFTSVKNGSISLERIIESNKRIAKLKDIL